MARNRQRGRAGRVEGAAAGQAAKGEQRSDNAPSESAEKKSAGADASEATESWSPSRGPSRRTEAREVRRRRSVARKARRRLLLTIGGGTIALALILGLVIPSVGNIATPNSDGANTGNPPSVGTQSAIQEGGLIEPGAEHEPYARLPPTSGPRYATGAAWGVHEEPVADELVLRNLEQGGVAMNHNLADEAQREEMLTFFEEQQSIAPGCLILRPYPDLAPGAVALTAWGWSDSFAGLDRSGVQAFIDDHRNQGPEYVGVNCGANVAPEPETNAPDASDVPVPDGG